MDPQAQQANEVLKQKAPQIYEMLSESGKEAFFPKLGIPAQSKDAEGTEINATIGQALEDNGEPMVLKSFAGNLPKKAFVYSSTFGNKELRELWKKEILRKSKCGSISLPVVTSGITHSLYIAWRMFGGKEVIIPKLFWGNYKLVFNAVLDTYELFDKGRFNLKGIERKLKTIGNKIILLNFPNNPTGYSLSENEVVQLFGIIKRNAEEKKIAVIVDDAYFGLFYEKGIYNESLFGRLSALHENVLAVKCDGITKECFAWGLRIGFLTFGFNGMTAEIAGILEDKAAGIIRGTVSNSCTLSQMLAIDGLKSCKKESELKRKVLEERYKEVKRVLAEEKYRRYFEALPFNSGYFMCIKLKKGDPDTIRKRLIKEGVGVIAIKPDLIRIAYSAVPIDRIRELFERILNEILN